VFAERECEQRFLLCRVQRKRQFVCNPSLEAGVHVAGVRSR